MNRRGNPTTKEEEHRPEKDKKQGEEREMDGQ
jgi:hypothetical protein